MSDFVRIYLEREFEQKLDPVRTKKFPPGKSYRVAADIGKEMVEGGFGYYCDIHGKKILEGEDSADPDGDPEMATANIAFEGDVTKGGSVIGRIAGVHVSAPLKKGDKADGAAKALADAIQAAGVEDVTAEVFAELPNVVVITYLAADFDEIVEGEIGTPAGLSAEITAGEASEA